MYAQQRSQSEVWDVPVPADRPDGRRPHLRGDHPRQLAVGEGRRRLPDGDRAPPRAAARAADRLRAEGAGDHRRARRRADGRRAARRRSTSTTSRTTRPYELVSYAHWSAEDDRIVAQLLVDGEPQEVDRARQRADRGARRRVRAAARDPRCGSATTTSTRWPRAPTRPRRPTSRPTSATTPSGASGSTRASRRRRCGRS